MRRAGGAAGGDVPAVGLHKISAYIQSQTGAGVSAVAGLFFAPLIAIKYVGQQPGQYALAVVRHGKHGVVTIPGQGDGDKAVLRVPGGVGQKIDEHLLYTRSVAEK